MSAIIISISNCKQPGLTEIRRRIIVDQHYKNYSESVFTVPYVLQHMDPNDQPSTLIPDITGVLIADNIKRVWVRQNGTASKVPEPNTIEMGMFDYFVQLQKNISDDMIITGQVLELDVNEYFDNLT